MERRSWERWSPWTAIADDRDGVGPLFDWYSNGDISWALEGSDDESQTTQASADFMRAHYANIAAVVIGRRLFDLTNGWNGQPAAGEHVFVVTHEPPKHWEYANTAPFTFVVASRQPSAQRRSTPATGSSTCPAARSEDKHCGLASSTRSSSISSQRCSARAGRSSRPAPSPTRPFSTTLPRSSAATA